MDVGRADLLHFTSASGEFTATLRSSTQAEKCGSGV
jgi:hypothetical protein